MSDWTVLITGVTGNQGGATARALAGTGASAARHDTPAAQRRGTRAQGPGRRDRRRRSRRRSLAEARGGRRLGRLRGAEHVGGRRREGRDAGASPGAPRARRGRRSTTSTRRSGSAHRNTGIPHFDNKRRVEETVRALGFPSYAIIRPVFFMENLTSPWFLNGDTLHAAMKPTTVLQMIAVDDIGKYGALAFTDPLRLKNRAIDIAGDAVTMPDGRPCPRQGARPDDQLRARSRSRRSGRTARTSRSCCEWFGDVGYDADIAGHAREFGIRPTTFEEWAQRLS